MEIISRKEAEEMAILFAKNCRYLSKKKRMLGKIESAGGMTVGKLSRKSGLSLRDAIVFVNALGYDFETMCSVDIEQIEETIELKKRKEELESEIRLVTEKLRRLEDEGVC